MKILRLWIVSFWLFCISLSALQIIDTQGISHDFSNAKLYKHETQELKTSREKDGVVRLNNWEGFRADIWLQQQDLGEYSTIRFESTDRYLVSLTKAEFEAIESYLVIGQDGKRFENNALRLIFPSLREMQWIRNLERIILEDFKPIPRPQRFYLLNTYLADYTLHQEPKPFVKMEGWFFSDLLPELSTDETKQVILYSRDGLKQNLEYPKHLEGAVLEKAEQGTFNLKSPQIPGGMWMKDIVYLQCDSAAIIADNSINSLIELSKVLAWEVNPELKFRIVYKGQEDSIPFGDALSEPQVFQGALYFELN